MKNKNIILTCKNVIFYSPKDEDIFFEWIKKIDCIKSIDTANEKLYLNITRKRISNANLKDLIGLFDRYEIDMKQLQQFLTEYNKKWFFDDDRIFDK